MPTSQVKPFDIPKPRVWEAYRRVAANKGAPGVDEVTLGEFEADLRDNVYKICGSRGVRFPPATRPPARAAPGLERLVLVDHPRWHVG